MGADCAGLPRQDYARDKLAMSIRPLFLAMVLSSAASATELSAFQEGKGVAAPSNQSTFSGITGGAAADKIPAYGSSPPEAQYYQGGQGAPSGPGMAKVQNCASMSPDDDPMKRQECEAVNLLARNPEVRPKFNVSKSDPMILANKHSRENAEPFFQSLGIGGTGSSTECSTRLETTPGQYTTETCSSFREVAEQQCTAGRVIKTDADANFTCDQTISAYEAVNCNRTLNVTVTTTQNCTPGTWLTGGQISFFKVDYFCDPGASGTTFVFYSPIMDTNVGRLMGAKPIFPRSLFYIPPDKEIRISQGITHNHLGLGFASTGTAGFASGWHGCSSNGTCQYTFKVATTTLNAMPLGCNLDESGLFQLCWSSRGSNAIFAPETIHTINPQGTVTTNTQWENGCSTLEARAQ